MIQPVQDILKPVKTGARGQPGPVDHDHAQAQFARRLQLGLRARATGILGHDKLNALICHQGQVALGGKRPARNHQPAIRQGQGRRRRIDQPQQIAMLRRMGERLEILLADGQKDPCRRRRQGRHRARDIRHMLPVITPARLPRRALERGQRNAGLMAGRHGVAAHPGGEGMRGVDDRADILVAQIVQQPGHPAKAPHPHRQGLGARHSGAPGIGKHGIRTAFGQRGGQLRSLGRTAQDKETWHG